MSSLRLVGHACVVLHSSFQRSSLGQSGSCIVTSEAEPLGITTSYELALNLLDRHRKKITSRNNAANYALCMWRDTIDGVDIILTSRLGRATMEVRLRITGADVVGEKEQKNEHEPEQGHQSKSEQGAGQGDQGDDIAGSQIESETVTQISDTTDAQPYFRTPHPEGQYGSIFDAKLRSRRWSTGMSDIGRGEFATTKTVIVAGGDDNPVCSVENVQMGVFSPGA
jgi:hypothetical protein